MSRAPLEHLQHDQQSQGASLRPARLAGIAGHGTLQVLRDASGSRVSIEGSWRPDDPDASIGALLRAAADGELVRFEGPLDDAAQSDGEQVEVEVAIRSHGLYRFQTDAQVGYVRAGEERRIFNFEPAQEHEVDAR